MHACVSVLSVNIVWKAVWDSLKWFYRYIVKGLMIGAAPLVYDIIQKVLWLVCMMIYKTVMM